MIEYPDAPRHIPATPALLEGWCGPVIVCGVYERGWHLGSVSYPHPPTNEPMHLDPMRPEVRDHLIRRLSLPGWMRDDAGLGRWQSAGLIACAAAGGIVVDVYIPWQASVTGGCRRVRYPLLHTGQPLVDHDGESATDAAALAHGCALMLDADTMLLPWLGGPRVWRRLLAK